jgi:predicted RNase H-like nuclease (RuvC/YqgF family)
MSNESMQKKVLTNEKNIKSLVNTTEKTNNRLNKLSDENKRLKKEIWRLHKILSRLDPEAAGSI